MARILKVDGKFYGDDGLVSLFRGDDWSLQGKIVDRVNGYETPVDLSAYSASAFFPSASGGPDVLALAVTGQCSALAISLGKADTPGVQTNVGGEGIYVVLKDNAGNLQTVPTFDQAISVQDRGFAT